MMEEKSMWKELLNRAGWILVFLLATILYQIPLAVTSILTLNAVPLLQSGLIVAGISIVVLALFIIGARKTQLASFNFSFFRAKDLARLGLSYLVIIGSNILGSILLQLSNETTTGNQSQINDMVQNSSLISSFFLLALLAPICEEILCRGIVPKKIFRGKENLGFAGGVNAGLKEVNTEYVILLNNDTEVFPDYIEELVKAIKKSKKIFSVSPMMIQSMNRDLMDDAGDGMCILGWGYQIGVGEKISGYTRAKDVFTACAGAAIYRKAVLDEIGYFDELHFAYLEDIDLGYRAKLAGYFNRYEPRAKVYHFGSGTSGSKYNGFKVRLAARNNIYLHYKNQANWQLLFNSFFLFAGVAIKAGFFYKKGFLKEYLEGLFEGIKNYCNVHILIDPNLLLVRKPKVFYEWGYFHLVTGHAIAVESYTFFRR